MEHRTGNSNGMGRISARSAVKARRNVPTRRHGDEPGARPRATAAGNGIAPRPQRAAIDHAPPVDLPTLARTLDGAIQAERRRLASVLTDDLVELLCSTRLQLSVVIEMNTDAPIGDALRGIDTCLSATVKSIRRLISDLGPRRLPQRTE